MAGEYTENSAIKIENLSKKYGIKKALDNISFEVKKGEIMGFLGPNGAGKSTAMNIITGYISQSSGNVFVDGINISEKPMEAKKKIGYLPEIPPLYTDMTVSEYLDFVYDFKNIKMDKTKHLKEIMEKVYIYDVKNRMIKNLSKGYKQRVGLAQALIGDPDILILDEPTVGLDPKQIMELRDVIREIGKERTVILSTHILQEVTAVCDSYTIINKGRIVSSGSLEEFLSNDNNQYLIRVKEEKENVSALLSGILGISEFVFEGEKEEGCVDFKIKAENDTDIRENVFFAFSKAGYPVLSFSSITKSLEDVFIKAITDDETKNIEKEENKEEPLQENETAEDKKEENDSENKTENQEVEE